MARKIRVAAAQVGSVHYDADRLQTLNRLIQLLKDAASRGAQIVLFPEITFTTFFPRHLFSSQAELDKYFEHSEDITQAADTAALFHAAQELGVDICVGYAERTSDGTGYNTCIYYSAYARKVLKKYRKVHLPGTSEPFENPNAVNQLEKRYFKPGDLGLEAFRVPGLIEGAVKADTQEPDTVGKGDPIVGMMICNDRRWPEAWRCYGLQGVELILCGYNSAGFAPDLWGAKAEISREEAQDDAMFHHRLVMQSSSYVNSCFSVSAARCGVDDGKYDLIAGSSIVDPAGRILAEATEKKDDVLVVEIDLDDVRPGKEKTFDFGRHRRLEAYGRITSQTGVLEPKLLS